MIEHERVLQIKEKIQREQVKRDWSAKNAGQVWERLT